MRLKEYQRIQLIRDASQVLVEGEEVVDVTIGSAEIRRNGQTRRRKATILVTDRRVVVFSKRLGTYGVQEYAFNRLSAVDHHTGFTVGQLNLRASGGGIEILQIDRQDVGRIAQVIRDRMSSSPQPGGQLDPAWPESPDEEGSAADEPGSAADEPGSVADELGKFARLRDDGVITDEEFAAQKAKLL